MTIEVTAKKVDEAINQGLKQLGVSLDEVNVEVVDAGGLFRKAKVRLTLERDEKEEQAVARSEQKPTQQKHEPKNEPADKPHVKPEAKQDKKIEKVEKIENAEKGEKVVKTEKPKQEKAPTDKHSDKKPTASDKPIADKPQKHEGNKAEKVEKVEQPKQNKPPRKLTEEDKQAAAHALDFVKAVVEKMGFADAAIEPDASGELLSITAPEGDDSLLIGRHGETLSALSYLAETCARAEKSHVSITVDCNGYRDRRAASLTAMAKRRANECAAKHRKIKLEPMERVDRRTIHNALTDDDRVSTASEGKEPHRYVVILPKNN